ncbi:MAG: hydrolase [Proteobacteria bacterium]|nr:MAG: hydrolase [Pseudomonadota bacterium]
MKFKILICAFAIATFSPVRIVSNHSRNGYFVVWNVGQGQWATVAKGETCTHFDIGGERMSGSKVKKLCGDKRNRLFISHWDWDHIAFAGRARKILRDSCLALPPAGGSSPRKMKLLSSYPPCPATPDSNISGTRVLFRAKDKRLGSNESSNVVLVENQILVPGDSPASQEKVWDESNGIRRTKWLLLGHHGSRTSTSEELLNEIPNLKIAIASARFKKYGHPHVEVTERLRRHNVPVLKTEDWGNIWFELPEPESIRKIAEPVRS